jgi:hypothetical protein
LVRSIWRFFLGLAAALLLSAYALTALGQGTGYNIGPVSVSGSVGFSSELYSVSGIQARRPWGAGRIFANAAASAYGLRYNLDLNISTEESSLRQQFNQIGLQVSYKWMSVAAGDVRPNFSQYSLNGVNVRGGLIEATPGPVLFSLTAGRSQRAIKPGADDPFVRPVYDRWLYAGRVGYRHSGNAHVQLITTYVNDSESSLGPGLDLAAAENATISTLFGLQLLERRLGIDGTATWSAYTSDTRIGSGTGGSLPGLFAPLMTERPGTSNDYAGRLSVRYSEGGYSVLTSYERVQPGFISLGLPHTRSDQETWSVRPQGFFMDRKLRLGLDYGQSRNNLLDNLTSTTRRQNMGLTTQSRISEKLTLSTAYRLLVNRIIPESPVSTVSMRQTTHNITISPSYNWRSGQTTHGMLLSTNLQLFDMRRTAQTVTTTSDFTNIVTTASYSLTLPSGLSISPAANLLFSLSDETDITSVGLNVSASQSFLDRLVTLGVNAGYTSNETRFKGVITRDPLSTQQFTMNVNAGYRLPFGDYLRLSVRGLHNAGGTGVDFSELQAVLQITHQF